MARIEGKWRGLGSWVLGVRNRYYLFIDLVALPLAAYLAFVLRLGAWDPGRYRTAACVAMALAPAVRIPLFLALGGYSRYWPFASLPELELLVTATALGALASMAAQLGLSTALGYAPAPRTVPYIELLLTGLALAGPRLGARLLYAASVRREAVGQRRRVFIVGAGEAGNMVAEEIQRNPQLGLEAVGFVDDDEAKHGLLIRGIRVLGPADALPELARRYRVRQVLIAIPTATGAEMRRIVARCQEAGAEALTLPGIFELISGRVEVQRFRPVQVEDLLAREPVQTDVAAVRAMLEGKRVLVTGAGGSIGSELCRQIAHCAPARLVLLGHGENSIYHIHRELTRTVAPAVGARVVGAQHAAPLREHDLDVVPVIADTRDAARIEHVFARYRPEVVLHAAAHKHVPLMELNPEEAVTNNVGGTRELVRASERFNVETFVMISTDKAVNPTSVMGMTKRIAEHIVQAAAQRQNARSGSGRFVAVRFGNVLGSRGSVVPLFQRQIEAGGPVTVTHPDVERYFMTIPEAVQLVLQAAALGQGGEVFVLDMGEPVKIVDLARDMIRLAGLEVGRDVDIAFTGLRPGEKLSEELFLDRERHARTVHEKIFVSRNGWVPPDIAGEELDAAVDRLLAAARAHDRVALFHCLREIAPECAAELGSAPAEPPLCSPRRGEKGIAER